MVWILFSMIKIEIFCVHEKMQMGKWHVNCLYSLFIFFIPGFIVINISGENLQIRENYVGSRQRIEFLDI